ncbi:DUF2062 domain-containing protein [Aneurinibacillus sp. Ricciae_BoGa-3]|uniref:DUF2062 domain-containing protein n=1 Tax=Aneurinibacillus sp. Ricciae_BoGa-3 TaxID=3022697 RepID=UPI0023427F89|nr:DUF2062 domain-containing protein [Aneurinibacillus sp. Ricciae_BoGa-3]WCK55841.1 DUF2062 domain-containing protein [Aneurinibacillus sp. Ricciae_BoGa-3]
MLVNLYRKLKLQYLKLLRAKGAPSIIARSFSLGIFIEFITLPTLGTAFLLLYPLNLLLRGNFAASLIGFIIGKFLLPLFFVINMSVGSKLIGSQIQHQANAHMSHFSLPDLWMLLKHKGAAFFVGSATNGIIVSLLCYAIVFYGLNLYRKKKQSRRLSMQLKKKLT